MRPPLARARRAAVTAAWCVAGGLVGACNLGGGAGGMPAVPSSALLDAYDSAVLANTEREAPTFAEVAPPGDPPDEAPRRFRAWLGVAWPGCEPCPWDQAATCTPQCKPGKPFVCVRPSRTMACRPEETVSTRVENGGEPVPPEGVYVFEGRWTAPGPELVIDRITPVHLPADAGVP